jgi:hypothetical protein
MSATRFTYQHLVALVNGDDELIVRLVEEGVIERRGDDRVLVDVDRVLLARTLLRDLEIDWPGVEVILRLHDELGAARRRIADLEAALAAASGRPGA